MQGEHHEIHHSALSLMLVSLNKLAFFESVFPKCRNSEPLNSSRWGYRGEGGWNSVTAFIFFYYYF